MLRLCCDYGVIIELIVSLLNDAGWAWALHHLRFEGRIRLERLQTNRLSSSLCAFANRFCELALVWALLRFALLHFALLCFALLCFALLRSSLLCFALLRFALLCFALICFASRCSARLRFALRCFALLCFALRCFASLCFALLCFRRCGAICHNFCYDLIKLADRACMAEVIT